jgi:hypothetical protein
MTLAVTIVIAAILALALILRIAISHSLQAPDGSRAGQIQPVDVEAFRNLINPAEDDFLRSRLSSHQFRVVRRARLRAAASYVRVAGRNSAVLIRIGEAALAGGDPRTAEAARQLVGDAILLRRNAALALVRIYVALAWPHSGSATEHLVETYERLNGSAMRLGRMQNPGVAVRL